MLSQSLSFVGHLVFGDMTGAQKPTTKRLYLKCTLPETNSSHLKIGRNPKGNTRKYSNHPFQVLTWLLVSGRVSSTYLLPWSFGSHWLGKGFQGPRGPRKSRLSQKGIHLLTSNFQGLWLLVSGSATVPGESIRDQTLYPLTLEVTIRLSKRSRSLNHPQKDTSRIARNPSFPLVN